jgi:hypothetical protein
MNLIIHNLLDAINVLWKMINNIPIDTWIPVIQPTAEVFRNPDGSSFALHDM